MASLRSAWACRRRPRGIRSRGSPTSLGVCCGRRSAIRRYCPRPMARSGCSIASPKSNRRQPRTRVTPCTRVLVGCRLLLAGASCGPWARRSDGGRRNSLRSQDRAGRVSPAMPSSASSATGQLRWTSNRSSPCIAWLRHRADGAARRVAEIELPRTAAGSSRLRGVPKSSGGHSHDAPIVTLEVVHAKTVIRRLKTPLGAVPPRVLCLAAASASPRLRPTLRAAAAAFSTLRTAARCVLLRSGGLFVRQTPRPPPRPGRLLAHPSDGCSRVLRRRQLIALVSLLLRSPPLFWQSGPVPKYRSDLVWISAGSPRLCSALIGDVWR